MTDEKEDKIITLRTGEEMLEQMLERKTSVTFKSIDDIIEGQADQLIELGARGALSDFTVMRPINPSVVHCIIVKLLSNKR